MQINTLVTALSIPKRTRRLDSLEKTAMKAVTRIVSAQHFGITDSITGTKRWEIQPKNPNSNPTGAHENRFWEVVDEDLWQLAPVPRG